MPDAPLPVIPIVTSGSAPAAPPGVLAPASGVAGGDFYLLSGITNPLINGPLIRGSGDFIKTFGAATRNGKYWTSSGDMTVPGSGYWVALWQQEMISVATATLDAIFPPASYFAGTEAALGAVRLGAGIPEDYGDVITTSDGGTAFVCTLVSGTPRWVIYADEGSSDGGGISIPAGQPLKVLISDYRTSAGFVGGLGATWAASGTTTHRWRMRQTYNGSHLPSGGNWTGTGTTPATAGWNTSGSAPGTVSLTAATVMPPSAVLGPVTAGSAPEAPGEVIASPPDVVAKRAAVEMIRGIDTRITGATPSAAMKLFTGIDAAWAGADFAPNGDCWLDDLRPQLTGVHMRAGAYTQSGGLIMITPRHALNVGHGDGPSRNNTPLYYVGEDGTVHSNSILKWANDVYPNNLGGLIDSHNFARPAAADLSVYLLTSAVPSWVHKAPILQLTAGDRAAMASYDPPTVAISQGNWTAGPAGAYGLYNTPDNRMAYVKSLALNALNELRQPFHHAAVVGDSGCPEFVLIKDVLYLYRMIANGGGGGPWVGDYVDYINELIGRCDAAAGISTGYTVSALTLAEI